MMSQVQGHGEDWAGQREEGPVSAPVSLTCAGVS